MREIGVLVVYPPPTPDFDNDILDSSWTQFPSEFKRRNSVPVSIPWAGCGSDVHPPADFPLGEALVIR
jgi:hypothetical protein